MTINVECQCLWLTLGTSQLNFLNNPCFITNKAKIIIYIEINDCVVFHMSIRFDDTYEILFLFRLAYRTHPNDTKLTFCNGVVLDKQQCQRSFGDWLHAIMDFCASLMAMEIDISAFACLCALTLITGLYLQNFSFPGFNYSLIIQIHLEINRIWN